MRANTAYEQFLKVNIPFADQKYISAHKKLQH